MGFDYLNGEPREAAAAAAAPLGPTGGAALYSRAAFDAVGGFDERIFLYYEDLDLALRLRARGARCELAPGAAAVHAYSQTLGAASGAKYARTGWSRGYMLRRYGVMGAAARRPAGARRRGRDLRRAAAQGPDREGARRAAAGLARRRAGCRAERRTTTGLSDLSLRRGLGAAPSQARAALRSPSPASRRRSRRSSGSRRSASSLPFAVAAKRRWATLLASGAGLDRGDPGDRGGRHELDLGGEPVAGDEARVLGARVGEARLPGGVADVPDDGLGDRREAPAGDPRPHVEVDVLAEGDVALVVAAELREELAAQQAGGAADAERSRSPPGARAARASRRPPRSPARRGSATGRRCRSAPRSSPPPVRAELQDARLDAAERRVGLERVEEPRHAARLEHRVGVEHEDRVRLGPRGAEVDGGGEAGVVGEGDVGDALALQILDRAVARSRCRRREARSPGSRRPFSSDPRHRPRCWREFQFGITTATDREALTG